MGTNSLSKIIFSVLLGIIFIIPCKILGQFNTEAPWMKEISKETKSKEVTFNDIVKAFDSYWLKYDKNRKGSGYKPFKRWEYFWKNNLHSDGTLITPREIWNIARKKSSKKRVDLKTVSWQPFGPNTHVVTSSWSAGQGRVNTVYVDPNNSSIVYVGTPAGGIWKSTNGGSSWIPLSDELPQIGVSGIVTDPTNSNIIYIATGDKDLNDTYSIGVLKSIDGGTTWNMTGLNFSDTFTRASEILIHPTNPNILWVATSAGLFKTTNAGVSWTNILNENIKDIKLKPGNPNTIYAVTPSSFYRSTNGGSSFAKISSGLPMNSSRLVIDVTPANSSYVYVLSADDNNAFQGLYRSTNSGVSFVKTAATTDIFESTQAWYDLALAVSRTNPDLVFTGCLNVWKSSDGGATFNKVSNWFSPSSATYTHADIHFLRFYDNKLYCGSDGGIYVSSNNGESFSSLTAGLQIGQFYSIAVSKQSSNKMVGGLQDNGGYAYSDNQWKNYYGADGMDTGVDPINSDKYYGFIQQGTSLYITTDGGNSITTSVTGPGTGNWVTPMAVNSQGEVFGGFDRVYKLDGVSWIGSTTVFSSNLEDLVVDPTNDNIMYAVDDFQLYKSMDKGVTFNLIYTFPWLIKDFRVHSTNSSILYAVTLGTDGTVYKSTNSGTTFTEIGNGLPAIGKNVIVHQANSPLNSLYLGTTLGVYYTDDSLSTWEPYDTNLPNVPVTDLEINQIDNTIIAATYGRGIWKATLSTTVDTQVPSAPTNLIANGTTSNSTNLSWIAATDNIAVTGYDIYQGSTLIATVASTSYVVTGLAPSTTYSFSIRAKDAAGNVSVPSSILNVTTPSTILTYCHSKGSSVSDESIGKVQIGSINNVSNGSGSGSGYTDFTSISTDLSKGNTYTISITPNWTSSVYSEGYSVWIDYNNDKDFDDIDELLFVKSPSTANVVTGNFLIPMTAIKGSTRMRVSMKYNGNASPCEVFPYGEVEDYTVNLVNSTVDTQAPTAPTNLAAVNTTSSSISLSWSSSSDNIGVTGYNIYQDGNFIATVSTTTYTVTGLSDATSYSFFVKAKDLAGNISESSNVLTVTTLSKYCESKGNNVVDEYIDYVAFGGIANTTTTNSGYGNFTHLIGNLPYGLNTITFSAGFTGTIYSENWSVWIDYNQNGIFEATEKVVTTSSNTAANLTATFTVPTTALAGQTRMRVQMKYGATSTACEIFSYGEVEDYTVNIGTSIIASEVIKLKDEFLDIVLYPNPVEDILKLDFKEVTNLIYKVFDIKGKELKSGLLTTEIDVSNLPSGIYILKIGKDQESVFKKFLKQ